MYKESDDYLFHFTKKYESLISIMTEKFKPFFCIEDTSHLYPEDKKLTMALPMTCFCDIPIERHYIHKEKYGNYGIALSKEWGMRNHLSLVNYTHIYSGISSSMRVICNYYPQYLSNRSEDEDAVHAFKNSFSILLMTSKPYEGKVFDKESRQWSNKTHRFYDEKEWRYIPLVDRLSWSVCLQDFNNDWNSFFNEIDKIQPQIQIPQYKLDFTVDDIRYIFLDKDGDKKNFLNEISKVYSREELIQIESLIQY
jgi:hypothetical protein